MTTKPGRKYHSLKKKSPFVEQGPLAGQIAFLQYIVQIGKDVDNSQIWKLQATIKAIRNVSICDRNKSALLKADVVQVLLNVIAFDSTEPDVVVLACEALWHLALYAPARKVILKSDITNVLTKSTAPPQVSPSSTCLTLNFKFLSYHKHWTGWYQGIKASSTECCHQLLNVHFESIHQAQIKVIWPW